MPAGLSGAGVVGVAFETTKGTYIEPNDASTIFVPILSESLKYTESRYFSPQIRETTMVSDAKQSFYHAEGDIEFEVDVNFLLHFLYASRHTIAKTGAGPYTYTYTPSTAGASSTAAGATTAKTLSITVIRNGIYFGYFGCVVSNLGFMIGDDGILKCRCSIIGEGEQLPTQVATPAWAAPALFGADANSIYTDTSGTAPAFGSAAVTDFEGYEFTANHNATAEHRIRSSRAAAYIAYHETEVGLNTTLDFVDRTEYNNFVATTAKAIRLEGLRGGVSFAAATQAIQVDVNRFVYESYDLGLSGLGDIVKASVSGRGIGIAGGSAYQIKVKSPVSIT